MAVNLTIFTDGKEVEITGSPAALRSVRLAILKLLSSPIASIRLPVAVRDPGPYTCSLAELVVERAEGPSLVSVTQGALSITGCDASLARLATWFDISTCHHSHFEPLPDDPHHSAESIPLIIEAFAD